MSCVNCRYFVKPDRTAELMAANKEGFCRRYPPVLDSNYITIGENAITENGSVWVYPIVSYGAWCGEFIKWGE